MAAEDHKKATSRSPKSAGTDKSGTKSRPKSTRERHIGNALRSVYQQTVNEKVPPEFLDLLGQLT